MTNVMPDDVKSSHRAAMYFTAVLGKALIGAEHHMAAGALDHERLGCLARHPCEIYKKNTVCYVI